MIARSRSEGLLVLLTKGSRGKVTAEVLSEIFGPAVLGSVLLVAGSLASGITPTAVTSAAVALLFVTGGPFAILVLLSRRGKISDHHVGRREQRAPVLLGTLGSICVGAALLVSMGAPQSLFLMIAGLVIGLLVVLVVNLYWKLSVHSAVSAYFVVAMTMLFGAEMLFLAVIPLAVGWARVKLSSHTWAQVLWGFATGIFVAAAYCSMVGLSG